RIFLAFIVCLLAAPSFAQISYPPLNANPAIPYAANRGYKGYQAREAAGVTRTVGTAYFAPVIIEGPITIDQLGTGMSTTGAGNVQFAIYNNIASTCRPGTEIAHTASVSTGSGTVVVGTLNANATLTAGLYWFGLNIDNNTAILDGTDNTFALMSII